LRTAIDRIDRHAGHPLDLAAAAPLVAALNTGAPPSGRPTATILQPVACPGEIFSGWFASDD
jgi:hypothetical protein